jgi:hypothetical protein
MTASFRRFSGACGILAGLAGLVYLAAFIVTRNPAALAPTLALLVVGLSAGPLLVGLYEQLHSTDDGYARLGLLFGMAGAGGAAVHAAFDLSNNLHPPDAAFAYPSPVDPRGFLTFVAAGIAILLFAKLIAQGGQLPRGLGILGWVSGIALILLYLAYLILLDPANPLLLVLIFASGILQPIWYLWAGWIFWNQKD